MDQVDGKHLFVQRPKKAPFCPSCDAGGRRKKDFGGNSAITQKFPIFAPVFLPAAGYRVYTYSTGQTTKCTGVGTSCGYWSASTANTDQATYVTLSSLNGNYKDDKSNGHSVRLVIPAE